MVGSHSTYLSICMYTLRGTFHEAWQGAYLTVGDSSNLLLPGSVDLQ